MFRQTYKVTLKTLFRSKIFWFMLTVFLGATIYDALSVNYSISILDDNGNFVKAVYDNEPEFTLTYLMYVKRFTNIIRLNIMSYTVPVFTVISTVLVLDRDYGDSFYEIEKSAGLRPSTYLLGRLSVLVTINFILATIASLLSLHLYVLTRGGVYYGDNIAMGFLPYIIDSTVRMMRVVVCMAWPTILFYIGITYFIGCLFKSGKIAALVSLVHTMLSCGINVFAGRIFVPEVYTDYFSTQPRKLMWYFYYYDTSSFKETILTNNTDFGKAAFCVLFRLTVGFVFFILSYILTRKREL